MIIHIKVFLRTLEQTRDAVVDTATTKPSHLVFLWFDSNLLVVYFVSVLQLSAI